MSEPNSFSSFSRILAISFLIFGIGVGCSNSTTGDRLVLLGSFKVTVDPADQTVLVQPIQAFGQKSTAGPSGKMSPYAALGLNDQILRGARQYVTPITCGANGNYNSVTNVWSANFRIKNTSSTTGPADTILTPLEMRIQAFTENAAPWDPILDVVHQINGDLPEQACGIPAVLTSPGCDADVNGYFDILWPEQDYSVSAHYEDDPGWNFSNKMGADNQLVDTEETECAFMQFDLNPAINPPPEFTAWFDIFGKLLSTATYPAPTVDDGAGSAHPVTTKDISPLFRVTALDAGPPAADRLRITGGVGIVGGLGNTCIDGDACDQDGTVDGAITVDYELNPNVANAIFVYQGNGTIESPSAVINIDHDDIEPTLTSIFPADGAIDVSPATTILMTFDGDLDATTATDDTIIILNQDGGNGDCSTVAPGQIVRSVTQPASNQILITPNSDLAVDTIHCVTICGSSGGLDCGAGVLQDTATNLLSATIVRKFTTGNNDTTPPIVSFTVPADGANGVSSTTTVQVVFNEAMDPSTINTTNILVEESGTGPVTGTMTLSGDGKTAEFTPDAAWDITPTPEEDFNFSTLYTIRVTTDVEDLAGRPLTTEFVSTFTTGAVADTTPPEIVEFLPSDGSANVNENVSPQITFNEPMDPSTINGTTIHMEKKDDSSPIPGTVTLSPDGLTTTFNPLNPLITPPATTYLISVEFACKDLAGNNLLTPQTAEFTTPAAPDTTPPTIRQVTPADNAVDVSRWTALVVVFSEPVDPNTVHTGTFTLASLKTDPPTAIPGSVTVANDGLSATFTQLNPPIMKNEDHRITVKGSPSCPDCVRDVAGNAMTADFTAEFNSQHNDNSIPFVVTVGPSDEAIDVFLNTNVVITFSEPIQPATVNSNTVVISDPATDPVPGTVRLLPDGIHARFTPDSNLVASSLYQVDTTNSVKNLAGTRATPFNSEFTTGTLLDDAGPSVTAAASAATPSLPLALAVPFATDVELWPSIQITFDEAMDNSTTVIDNNIELIKTSDSSKVATRLSVLPGATIVTINPVNLLDLNETFRVNLKTGLRDLAGFPLLSFTSFDFTTLTADPSQAGLPTIDCDPSPCTGLDLPVDPFDTETGVSKTKVITIRFSEPIDPDTVIPGNFSVQQTGGNPPPPKADLTIALDATRSIVTITPLTTFKGKQWYEIRVTDLIVDDGNNALDCNIAADGACDAGDWISTFKTQ